MPAVTIQNFVATLSNNATTVNLPHSNADDTFTITLLPSSDTSFQSVAVAQHSQQCLDNTNLSTADGNPQQPRYPILAGQTARYLYLQTRDFKEGRRTEPQMTPFLTDLSREDMLDLASFFAVQKARPAAFTPDEAKVERGKKKAVETLCTMCHLGGFMGQNEVPRVAGQYYEYIVKQMQDFKNGRRTNDAGTMTSVSKTLSDADIDDLAHYLAALY